MPLDNMEAFRVYGLYTQLEESKQNVLGVPLAKARLSSILESRHATSKRKATPYN